MSDEFSGGYEVCRFRSKHLPAVIQWSSRGGRVDERDLASVARERNVSPHHMRETKDDRREEKVFVYYQGV